jgi:NAD(P)-dependent dehydrogenase (short-subunit alcohol dehydrogenase family)
MANRLAGKIALITGGASGLGAAMAAKFVAEGARVVVTDIDADGAARKAAELGDAAAACGHDVTSPDQWHAALAFAQTTFGGLHILVNNAGIGTGGTVESTSFDDWRHVHAVDLDSVFFGCKLALPLMAATCARDAAALAGGATTGSKLGSILNISSIAGVIAAANMAAYNSAKAGVRHLSKSVALHCARERYNITCNSIHPVFIDTPILDNLVGGMDRDVGLAKLARQIPLGRVGEPDDVAWGAVYLVSDEAKFVTGTELYIDGGISAT